MARITLVQKARKDQGSCESCGNPINAGDSYRWCAPGGIGARKRKRHATCPVWRPSELSSSKMVTAWAARESAEDALDALNVAQFISTDDGEFDADGFIAEVRGILEEVANAAEECASDYQDGIDALPEQLQEGPTAEESREKVEALEEWQSELESFDPSNDWDAPERDVTPDGDDEPDDEYAERFAEAADEWAQEVIDEARSVLDEFAY